MHVVHAIREAESTLYVCDDEGVEVDRVTAGELGGDELDERIQALGYARTGEWHHRQSGTDAVAEVAPT